MLILLKNTAHKGDVLKVAEEELSLVVHSSVLSLRWTGEALAHFYALFLLAFTSCSASMTFILLAKAELLFPATILPQLFRFGGVCVELIFY